MGLKNIKNGLGIRTWSLLAVCFLLFFHGEARAAEKITIGAVEEVILLPWNIRVPARIDTGAATSSLDVCEIKPLGKKEIQFRLPDRCGGHEIRMPVVAWRSIQSTEGKPNRRPVVEMEICLGSRKLRTQVTLNDRSQMEYPFLIGRRTLDGNYIVDVSRSNILPPRCSEGPPP
jgi:hypothetical protein